MSVCNNNFNSDISEHSGCLEFSLVAAATEIPKWGPLFYIIDFIVHLHVSGGTAGLV